MGFGYAEVALPVPRSATFTYRIPEPLGERTKVGVRAVVPFGRRRLTGVVVGLAETCEIDAEILEIAEVRDERPVFDARMLQLCRWVAEYYLCSWGEALKTALPAGMGLGGTRTLTRMLGPDRATSRSAFRMNEGPSSCWPGVGACPCRPFVGGSVLRGPAV